MATVASDTVVIICAPPVAVSTPQGNPSTSCPYVELFPTTDMASVASDSVDFIRTPSAVSSSQQGDGSSSANALGGAPCTTSSSNLTTHDPVVLSRSPPGMSTAVRTQRAMVATMGSGEGAELLREFVLNVGPAAWPPSIGIAMWLVSKVVGLSDVE